MYCHLFPSSEQRVQYTICVPSVLGHYHGIIVSALRVNYCTQQTKHTVQFLLAGGSNGRRLLKKQ